MTSRFGFRVPLDVVDKFASVARLELTKSFNRLRRERLGRHSPTSAPACGGRMRPSALRPVGHSGRAAHHRCTTNALEPQGLPTPDLQKRFCSTPWSEPPLRRATAHHKAHRRCVALNGAGASCPHTESIRLKSSFGLFRLQLGAIAGPCCACGELSSTCLSLAPPFYARGLHREETATLPRHPVAALAGTRDYLRAAEPMHGSPRSRQCRHRCGPLRGGSCTRALAHEALH